MDVLDRNALLEILKRSDPRSVIQLCGTDRRFRNLCREGNESIFRTLMQVHYPQFPVGDNPKRQYYSITAQEGIEYTLVIKEELNNLGLMEVDYDDIYVYISKCVIPEVFPQKAYANLSEEEIERLVEKAGEGSIHIDNFKVLGNEILKSVILSIYRIELDYGFPEFQIKAYKTLEDAVDDFLEKNLDLFEQYFDYTDSDRHLNEREIAELRKAMLAYKFFIFDTERSLEPPIAYGQYVLFRRIELVNDGPYRDE